MTVASFDDTRGYDKLAIGEAQVASLAPREAMAARLPRAAQPFLTWLTAKTAPGEAYRTRTPTYHVVSAFLWLIAGVVACALILARPGTLLILLPGALIAKIGRASCRESVCKYV